MSRAEAKARTRQLLLDSAHRVFVAKGFAAASVEEIAAGAGFTRGAFYANFADKAAVLWELAEDEQRMAIEALHAGLDAAEQTTKVQALQDWFDARLAHRPLERAIAELLHQVGHTPEGRARLARTFSTEREVVVRLLEAVTGELGVELPIPVEHFAAMGFALGNGLFQQHLADPAAVPSTLFSDGLAYLWFGVLAVGAGSEAFTPARRPADQTE